MPALDPNACLANLGEYANKPTTIIRIQYRMHELEEPVTAMWLAKDLDLKVADVSKALLRLVNKGLAKRWKIPYRAAPSRRYRGKRNQLIVLRRTSPAWVYEILQER